MNDKHEPAGERLIEAYRTMVERVHEAMDHLGEEVDRLQEAVGHARDRAVELGELTREEAENLAAYVKRDLEEARRYLAEERHELAGWFYIDRELIEASLLEFFFKAADPTEVELLRLKEQAREAAVYRTGEISGPGALQCTACGELIHFSRPGRIPPCPKCHGTTFVRKSRRGGEAGQAD